MDFAGAVSAFNDDEGAGICAAGNGATGLRQRGFGRFGANWFGD